MFSSKFSLAGTDDDDEFDEALYHDGHWAWGDDKLEFVSDLPRKEKSFVLGVPKISGPVNFKAELDVFEQRRFQRRYQRKYKEETAVVTLQDIKDLVLYTAPQLMVTTTLVNALHTTTAERFLRALIFYCQYFLQTLGKMKWRTTERQKKIPTRKSEEIEAKYQKNLTELRLLVGKEYFAMILGSSDFKFHHFGGKSIQSMSNKDGFLYEGLMTITSQIVWIALNRKERTLLDVEVNRLFRSHKYNLRERYFGFDLNKSMTDVERRTMLGRCAQPVHRVHTHTPLFEEFESERDVDYRVLGLGLIQYDDLNSRLKYFEQILSVPESMFPELKMTLGIIGLPRRNFDIMLKMLEDLPSDDSTGVGKTASVLRQTSKTSASSKKSVRDDELPIIHLPHAKTGADPLPDVFPSKPARQLRVDKAQQKKWFNRALVYQKRLEGETTSLLK